MTVPEWMTGEGKRGIRVATIVNATLSHGGPGSGEIFHTNKKQIKKLQKYTRVISGRNDMHLFSAGWAHPPEQWSIWGSGTKLWSS